MWLTFDELAAVDLTRADLYRDDVALQYKPMVSVRIHDMAI